MGTLSKLKKKIKANPVTAPIAHTLHAPIYAVQVAVHRFPIFYKETQQAKPQLAALTSRGKKVYFCGVPTHDNLGDQAQASCIRKWLRENMNGYEVVELTAWPFYSKGVRKRLESLVTEQDVFVIQSGYCTTETHYNHFMHRYIAKTFLNNPILIMPQTVNFHKEAEGWKTGAIYDRHPKLLFLARDQLSWQYAKNYFKQTEVLLYPDIVTSLIGTKTWKTQRNGVLICVRNDGEKLYTDEEIQALRQRFSAAGLRAEITDTDDRCAASAIEESLNKKLAQFASYQIVITDRYHGTIFSMIANTPVIVLATKDHKVKTGTEWFRGVYDGAYWNAASAAEAYSLAIELLENHTSCTNQPYFKEKYYDQLYNRFQQVCGLADEES